MGAPGSGKGTQASTLSQRLGIAHIATGDLFREAVRRGSELGQQVKSYMDRGVLVPNEITIRMLLEGIDADDCRKGYILDGFPRTLEQAKALDRALEERGQGLDLVVYFKVANEELVKRLGGRLTCRNCQTPHHLVASPPRVAGSCDQCGGELYQRDDDSPDTVRRRLEVYFAETASLIDYYREAGKLVEVDGEREIESVSEQVLAALTSNRNGHNHKVVG